jgi:hypothetical protein
MEIIIEILGWIGTFSLISAYALLSFKKIASNSWTYQLLNLCGAICFIINTLAHKAFAPAFLNIVWVFIGAAAIYNMLSSKSTSDN